MKNEIEIFNDLWERETAKTIQLLQSLPRDKYDFRPDPEGRSLGELAWHLAEGEAYGSFGIERGGMSAEARPPGLDRPRTIGELAPGFERIHRDAAARVKKLRPEDLDRSIQFFTGQPISVRDVLWDFMLLHGIHHRGQLALMCRQSGGRPAPLFGPTRETMPLRKPTTS
jgi:uncharacterized damage-inducible protein DinB